MLRNSVSDREIKKAFVGTDFGSKRPRDLLEQGVLKTLAKYSSGSTLTAIMVDLKLITYANKNVTKRGKDFLFQAFCTGHLEFGD